jgi:tetratricopeptide (TPR) repeat protein
MLQTIGEYAREQLEESGESEAVTRRFVTRYAAIAHDIRDGIEGVDQVGSLHRAVEEDANILSALETLLAMAVAGDASAIQEGLQMCGDLYMCWHIRGKNLTARDYATAFLDADRSGRPTVARSGALISAGLGSFALGHLGQADEQWAEAYRVAEQVGAGREMCVAAFSRAFVLIAMGDDAAGRWAKDALERSRALGSPWVLGFSLTVHGLVSAGIGDTETAEAEYLEALSIQEDLGDLEGAGLTLGFFAALCASRGERPRALDMYRRAVTGYETIGDRAEEARMHDEMAWTHLLNDDSARARHHFLASARAYTDVASVRGVGLALIGLAAAEAVENRPQRAVQLVAAAEVYAHQEGIVNVYSDETPGREYLDRASAVLSEEDAARATEMGRRLTITQALDLARIPVVATG